MRTLKLCVILDCPIRLQKNTLEALFSSPGWPFSGFDASVYNELCTTHLVARWLSSWIANHLSLGASFFVKSLFDLKKATIYMAVSTLNSLLISITSSTSSLSIILSLESLGNLWKLPCPIHSTRKCQEIGADSVTRPLGSKPCQFDAGCPLLLPAGRANTTDGDNRGGGGATIFANLT